MKTLFTWYGRIGRSTFARGSLAIYLIFLIIDSIGSISWTTLHPEDTDVTLPSSLRIYPVPHSLAIPFLTLAMIAAIILGMLMLSFSIRRLRDIGLPGWSVIVAIVVLVFLPKIDLPFPFGSIWQWIWFALLSAAPAYSKKLEPTRDSPPAPKSAS